MLTLPPFELAGRLAMAVALAVFMGLAFEETYKTEERSRPGGIRTFPMLAMCGATLYLIEPAHAFAFIAGLLGLAAWLHAYLRTAPAQPEAPTFMVPASNLLAYVIGAIALMQPPWVAVALTVAAVLLLGTRERLHRLIHIVPRDELLTLGMFLILVGIILPLVPHERVSSLTPLTPYGVWLAVVTVCTLSYLSYLLQRYAPIKNAALLPAVLGGAYSSTATTVVLAKRLREAKQASADISAGIVAATAIMYVRLGVVVALFDIHIALTLAPALAALCAIGAALAIYEWRRPRTRSTKTNLAVLPKNPLQIPAALIFAALIVVISVISAWVHGAFGESGILVLSAVVGASDIDPFVLNIAQGGVAGMSIANLSAAVLIAAASNNVAKAAYAIGFGGMTAARRPAAMLLALALLGLLAAAIYVVKA
ncbi:MAG: MgtC/SapB family protein [Hyphomicrobiales bacterium]